MCTVNWAMRWAMEAGPGFLETYKVQFSFVQQEIFLVLE